MKKILVTGGCGYIGSHTIVNLVEKNFKVVSVDSFLRSTIQQLKSVEKIVGQKVDNYEVDLCDKAATRAIFEAEKDIDAVIHFAALKSVGESVREPLFYYRNNIDSLVNVLECCAEFGVKKFLFSSSCSVYGNSTEQPVTEATVLQTAESPYGHTKQIGEGIIQHFAKKHSDLDFVLLRYFNPAGAHGSGLIGEESWGKPVQLVPIIMEVAAKKMSHLTVFGDNYPTRDGSCIRDYIHVLDLAEAHTLCLDFLEKQQQEDNKTTNCEIFNVGIGQGVTVLEAIQAYEKVSGKPLNYVVGERRSGDVVAIYSDYTKAKKLLGWQPQYTIDDIMATAIKYEQNKIPNNIS